jgi:hypothetical protein
MLEQPHPSNVVQLHPHLESSRIQNAEDAINLARQVRVELAEDLSELTLEQICGWLGSYGIFTDSGKINSKDIVMLGMAIEAALYRYYGLEHALHEVTEEVVELTDEVD